MNAQTKIFGLNVSVGLLGVFVGFRYLLDPTNPKNIVLGFVCTLLACSWLAVVFLKKRRI